MAAPPKPRPLGATPPRGGASPLIWATLLLFTLLALALRLGYQMETVIDNPIRVDARQYVLYGANLVKHGVFSVQEPPAPSPLPDSLRPPGYPALVALTMLVGGDRGFYPLLLRTQAVLSSLLVPLTFLAGLAFLPAGWALAAAGLIAVEPHLTAFSGYVLSETLFTFLLLSGMTAMCWAIRRFSGRLFLLAGTAFGAATLTNPTILPFPFLVAAGSLLLFPHSRKPLFRGFLLLLLPLLLAWGGWALRDAGLPAGAQRSGDRAIVAVVHGSYPDWTFRNPDLRFFPYRDDPEIGALTSSWGGFARIFSRRFAERPLRHLSWYLLEKPVWLWTWDEIQGQGDVFTYPAIRSLYRVPPTSWSPPVPPSSPAADATRVAVKILHWPLVLLGFAGAAAWAVRLARRRATGSAEEIALLPVFGILVFYTVFFAVFAPLPRYATPLRPMLFLGAGWTAAAAWSWIRAGRGKTLPAKPSRSPGRIKGEGR